MVSTQLTSRIFKAFLPVITISLLVWIFACVLLPSHVIVFSSVFHLFSCLTLVPFVRPQVLFSIVPSFHELPLVFTIDDQRSNSISPASFFRILWLNTFLTCILALHLHLPLVEVLWYLD